MKIGILTFHCAINYGAVLQAYGLQEYLKSLGHDAFIIDYRPNYLQEPYRTFRWQMFPKGGLIDKIKWFMRECLVIPIRWRRKHIFQHFIEKYLNLYQLDLSDGNNDFDIFIFGSDQIWNPNITNLDKVYFGNSSAFNKKRKFSYAASVGSVERLKNINKDLIKDWLGKFEQITVREKVLKEYLTRELGLNSIVVPDPVICAGKGHFEKISAPIKFKYPFLLFFTLARDEYAIDIANKIAKEQNLKIIEIVSNRETLNSKIHQLLSPNEFISYFMSASYVVTTSYHGMVFSVIFEKEFNIIVNDEKTGERARNFLESCGMESRIIKN